MPMCLCSSVMTTSLSLSLSLPLSLSSPPLSPEWEGRGGSLKYWGKKKHSLAFQNAVLSHLWRTTHSYNWVLVKKVQRMSEPRVQMILQASPCLCLSLLFCLLLCNSMTVTGNPTMIVPVEFSRVQRDAMMPLWIWKYLSHPLPNFTFKVDNFDSSRDKDNIYWLCFTFWALFSKNSPFKFPLFLWQEKPLKPPWYDL